MAPAASMRGPGTISVGTLSFARCQDAMLLPPRERVRLIMAAVEAYAPDLLITAGYAIHSRRQLHRLAAALADEETATSIITEVHFDGRPQRELGRLHAMWAISPDGDLHRFGRQCFATRAETREPHRFRLKRFARMLDRRCLNLPAGRVFGLCCGELNIVEGRRTPHFIDDAAAQAMMAATIIVNPTHDRMSHAGTLDAKRRFLSQPHPDGAPRAYVSCSNWEACGLNGRVQRPSPTLHTVYVSGEPLAYDELADGAFGFAYRRWQLDLARPPPASAATHGIIPQKP